MATDDVSYKNKIPCLLCGDHFERVRDKNPCEACPSMSENEDTVKLIAERLNEAQHLDTEEIVKALKESAKNGVPGSRLLVWVVVALLGGGGGGSLLFSQQSNAVPATITNRMDQFEKSLDGVATSTAINAHEAEREARAASEKVDALEQSLDKKTLVLTAQSQANAIKLAGVEASMKNVEKTMERQQSTLELILQRLPRQ